MLDVINCDESIFDITYIFIKHKKINKKHFYFQNISQS